MTNKTDTLTSNSCADCSQLKRERDGWMESAAQFCRNMEYYRGLLDRIGRSIGPEAYTADDGSVSDEVLRAKVPEIIERLLGSKPTGNETPVRLSASEEASITKAFARSPRRVGTPEVPVCGLCGKPGITEAVRTCCGEGRARDLASGRTEETSSHQTIESLRRHLRKLCDGPLLDHQRSSAVEIALDIESARSHLAFAIHDLRRAETRAAPKASAPPNAWTCSCGQDNFLTDEQCVACEATRPESKENAVACGNPVMIGTEWYGPCRKPSGHDGECERTTVNGGDVS